MLCLLLGVDVAMIEPQFLNSEERYVQVIEQNLCHSGNSGLLMVYFTCVADLSRDPMVAPGKFDPMSTIIG